MATTTKKPREGAGFLHGGSHPSTSFGSATSSNSQGIPQASLLGHVAGALFDSGDAPPFEYPTLPAWGKDRGNRFLQGEYLAQALGRTSEASEFGGRLSKYNSLHPNGQIAIGQNPYLNADGSVNWRGLGSSEEAQNALTRGAKSRYQGMEGDFAAAMNAYKLKLGKSVEMSMKQGLISEIDPSLKRAQEAADANLGTSAIDAGTEAAIRSRFAAAARQDADTQLARVSAGLGLGNTANSPAAAALAQQRANSMDSQMTSGLRDMSIQTQQMNRQQHSADIELATRIATARYNILNGNSKSIIEMQGDIPSMLDALYSRNASLDLQKQAMQQSGNGSPLAGAATGAVSGMAAGAPLGPYGAAIGGGVGGVGGWLGSR